MERFGWKRRGDAAANEGEDDDNGEECARWTPGVVVAIREPPVDLEEDEGEEESDVEGDEDERGCCCCCCCCCACCCG